MKMQLFDFNGSAEVRTMREENGEFWFVAKDVAAALGVAWSNQTLSSIPEKWRLHNEIHHAGQKRKVVFINEAALYKLAFRSNKPEAEAFTEWVASEVLPALRKTGTYSLSALMLSSPDKWTKTFPDEFMRQVMKLYGYEFNRKKGTPGFVGHFINKYVYNTLDRKMSDALKTARGEYAEKKGVTPDKVDEVAFLHQFLNTDGKGALREHLISVTTLASGSSTIEGFDGSFRHIYGNRNQLEMLFLN